MAAYSARDIEKRAAPVRDPTRSGSRANAAALRRLAADEALRRRLQEKARARASEVFDIRRVIEPLDAARARLLAGR